MVNALNVWRGLYVWARSAKRWESSQSPSSKFIGFRMERDSWQMFIGQEISFHLLRNLWEISLSVLKFYFPEGTCVRFSIPYPLIPF